MAVTRLYVAVAMPCAIYVERTLVKVSILFTKRQNDAMTNIRTLESYGHFCQHFRARPGSKCTNCKKCDLYKTAPDDEAVQLAATRARNQYLQAHPDIHTTNLVIGPKKTLDKLGKSNGIHYLLLYSKFFFFFLKQ